MEALHVRQSQSVYPNRSIKVQSEKLMGADKGRAWPRGLSALYLSVLFVTSAVKGGISSSTPANLATKLTLRAR